MKKQAIRWPLAAAVALAFAAGLSPIPAAAAPAPPSPSHGRSHPDLGILSERRMTLGGTQARSISARPAQPLAPCAAAWRVVNGQDGSWNNFLGGVAAVSPTDIWAVGNSQDPNTANFHNLAEHWDGTAWSTLPVPDPGNGSNALNDVAAIAANDVWAVGVSVSNGSTSGVTYHWNGTSWTFFNPATGGSLNDVVAFASNDVWAVGESLNPSNILMTQIQHWNGLGWTLVSSPNVGAGNNVLFGVGGSSSTNFWAVGYSRATNSSPRQTLIEHSDGTSWTVTASPTNSTYTLYSVAAASGTDARAVGKSIGSNGLPFGIAVHWNGTNWLEAGVSQPSVFGAVFSDVVFSSPNYWAVGFDIQNGDGNTPGPMEPLALQSIGAGWGAGPTGARIGSGDNVLFAVSAPVAGDVWAVGTYRTPARVNKNLIENYSGLAAPGAVTATAGDQAATVNWTAPCDGGSIITSFVVTAYDGCTIQGSAIVTGATAITTNFTGLTNGTAFTFKVAAVNGFGVGPQSGSSTSVTPTGATKPTWVTACSPQQYTLAGSNGSTWMDIDATNLSVTFAPGVDSFAILSGNADLWTALAGYNQDIGIAVSGGGVYPTSVGQPEAWKESGGFAGTFSPNAAYVQAVIPVLASIPYTAKLQWKANQADAGSIFAGAGPIGGAFSPTRLTIQLIPKSAATVLSKTSQSQYTLTGNNGSAWADIDSINLSVQFLGPASGGFLLVSGNADLWTANAGYNQDIGVSISGGSIYPSAAGQPEAWKESGGFAGTFSPNAAFVQATLGQVNGTTTYTAKLQWKTNKPDPGTIYAGAGPINGHFSPTTLTVVIVPYTGASALVAVNTAQYIQNNSDGTYWQSLPNATGNLGISSPASYLIAANIDLWTAVAGYNQDVGIMVSGGAYGSGTLVAWKESGGFAGTFSPNAAFVATELHLQPGNYTVSLVWKANRLAEVANAIYVGAGPINGHYSTTSLTAMQLS